MVSSYQDALQKLWTGRCDVFVREDAVNPANGRNEPEEVLKLADVPCRISFQSIPAAVEQESAARLQQTVRLFLAREYLIPPGSKIVVRQNGAAGVYACSGEPAVYSCHQEIMLESFKGWA